MTVTLRAMSASDLDAVMAIERELFAEDAWTEGMFRSELGERDTRHYLVVDDEGVVVGYAGLCAYAPHEAYVQTIAVAPSHQRHGAGTALLDALLAEAERRGCPHVDLEVRADNEVALGMYERRGFRRIGVRRRYYQPSGTDAVVMRREARR